MQVTTGVAPRSHALATIEPDKQMFPSGSIGNVEPLSTQHARRCDRTRWQLATWMQLLSNPHSAGVTDEYAIRASVVQ